MIILEKMQRLHPIMELILVKGLSNNYSNRASYF